MELEEMKAVWADLSQQLEEQKKLTDEIILKMTQQQYQARLNKIIVPELFGTVVCFGMALILLINISKLDSLLTLSTGLISLAILILLPIFSLRALRRLNNINIVANNYKQTMLEYTQSRKHLFLVQRIGLYISFILMFVMVPPLVKIMKGKEMTIDATDLLIYVPLALIFFTFFTSFVYRSYKRVMRSTENVLRELE